MWSILGSKSEGGVEGEPVILEDCPSPETEEDYIQLSKAARDEVLQLIDSPDWKIIEHGNSDEVKLYELVSSTESTNGSTVVNPLRTEGIVDCHPKKLFDMSWKGDLALRQKWDSDIMELKTVQTINEDNLVIYRLYRAPVRMVAPREFVALQCKYVMEDGTMISYGTSVNHKDCRARAGIVRGTAKLSAMVIKPIPEDKNKCFVIRLVQIDPRGMIPGWVVNAGKKKAASSFLELKRVALEPSEFDVKEDDEEPHQIQHSVGKMETNGKEVEEEELVQQQTNHSSSKPKLVAPQMDQEFSKEIRDLLGSIQSSLSNVQKEVKSNTERLKALELKKQMQSLNEQVVQSHHAPAPQPTASAPVDGGVGWDFVTFALVWPFIAYSLLDIIQRK